jgi:hypothetical protein
LSDEGTSKTLLGKEKSNYRFVQHLETKGLFGLKQLVFKQLAAIPDVS